MDDNIKRVLLNRFKGECLSTQQLQCNFEGFEPGDFDWGCIQGGTTTKNCHPAICHVCTDLAILDEELSSTYRRLLELVYKRSQTVKKPHQTTFIRDIPVEILSLIFGFVKKSYNNGSAKPLFSQPDRSPPLLLGAVCSKWRAFTLRTAELWTDIIINLEKPVEEQLCMIKQWAGRSGVLPLNLTIFMDDVRPQDFRPLSHVLRSYATRWTNLALQTPWAFQVELLENLQETPPVVSFYCQPIDLMEYIYVGRIQMQHPLRPRYFYSHEICGLKMMLKWDNLVHFTIGDISVEELLHIIQHAHNLIRCETTGFTRNPIDNGHFLLPTAPITSRSLIHLQTNHRIIEYVTLPSLQHLEYETNNPTVDVDHLAQFISRSNPPLQTFILRCYGLDGDEHNPHQFRQLPGITHLSVTVETELECEWVDNFLEILAWPNFDLGIVLPNLEEIRLDVPTMPQCTWRHLTELLEGFRMNMAGQKPSGITYPLTSKRPLSKVYLCASSEHSDPIERCFFMELLAIKNLGFDLVLQLSPGVDWYPKLAKLHFVEL